VEEGVRELGACDEVEATAAAEGADRFSWCLMRMPEMPASIMERVSVPTREESASTASFTRFTMHRLSTNDSRRLEG
jgi:hypothetical protein